MCLTMAERHHRIWVINICVASNPDSSQPDMWCWGSELLLCRIRGCILYVHLRTESNSYFRSSRSGAALGPAGPAGGVEPLIGPQNSLFWYNRGGMRPARLGALEGNRWFQKIRPSLMFCSSFVSSTGFPGCTSISTCCVLEEVSFLKDFLIWGISTLLIPWLRSCCAQHRAAPVVLVVCVGSITPTLSLWGTAL